VAWHSSGTDPYHTTEASQRYGFYGIGGYPTLMMDGYDKLVGAYTNNTQQYNWYMARYNAHKAISSPLTIDYLSNSYGGSTASIKVNIYLEEGITSGSTVHFVLWEDNLMYGNKPQGYVERAYKTATLTISNPDEAQVISKSFNLSGSWVKSNLGVSVFVQAPNKNIYNGKATMLTLGTALAPTSLGRVKALFN